MGKKNQREIQFDLLRILSMLLVMPYHYTTQFDKTVLSTDFLILFPFRMVILCCIIVFVNGRVLLV